MLFIIFNLHITSADNFFLLHKSKFLGREAGTPI